MTLERRTDPIMIKEAMVIDFLIEADVLLFLLGEFSNIKAP
jgi:hypothetical protein